jgi:hypothetical protein
MNQNLQIAVPGGSITNCVVLNSSNINQHLCSRVLHRDAPQNRGTVVCDGDPNIVGVANLQGTEARNS